ncbi:FAD-dependent monooxygenase [Herbiconiux sp. CPCC 203407]|uniref:FAD-dependent monooxygenase n=1 Tax=Herbiconiux oxytropis TaxID=2970915 RepID=A0AA41XIP0_9MICO|nr:FAD-dependent monooxygenase [Herbiconiux oxytropis]MCS5723781.1 FAD-dependent monooxygenase [Herbiconiux oxytropis]MCS5725876.1 FAD-dependent monooxygenase [Herbiconiux oxytropis]
MTSDTLSSDQPYLARRALVVGGSIGGLTTALLLKDIGFDVDVYERTATPLHGRGSGIVLQPDTLRWFEERSSIDSAALKTSTGRVQYLDRENRVITDEERRWEYTSWGTFYRALLADFGTDHYHLGAYASGFDDDGDSVTVRFADGRVETADLVVFADGINSPARAHFDADAEPTYSGYVGWRGTVPLRELSEATRVLMGDAITYSVVPNSHITLYPIPGEDGVAAEEQLMNYVWYRNVPAGPELTELLTGINGFVGAVSLHPGQVQERFVRELRETAAAVLAPAAAEVVLATAEPYLQVVLDVRSRRMALGRTALLGDAACSARPHAAAGTAKAAADAWALRDALLASDGDVAGALAAWEPAQLELSRALLDRVTEMGDRSQFHNTWIPGDPSLRFGLYGPGVLHPIDRQPQAAAS